MKRGSLIVYDENGKPWHVTGDAEGDILPHEYPAGLPYVELPFGALDGVKSFRIEPNTKALEVLERFEVVQTMEELKAENDALRLDLLLSEGVI